MSHVLFYEVDTSDHDSHIAVVRLNLDGVCSLIRRVTDLSRKTKKLRTEFSISEVSLGECHAMVSVELVNEPLSEFTYGDLAVLWAERERTSVTAPEPFWCATYHQTYLLPEDLFERIVEELGDLESAPYETEDYEVTWDSDGMERIWVPVRHPAIGRIPQYALRLSLEELKGWASWLREQEAVLATKEQAKILEDVLFEKT